MSKTKFFAVLAAAAFLVSISGYAYSLNHSRDIVVQAVPTESNSEPQLCHLDKKDSHQDHSNHSAHSAAAASASKDALFQQEQQEGQQPPSHNYSAGNGCSRPNPSAEEGAELNGVDPQTVGCKCAKRCENGHTQEDLSRDKDGKYVCKNACHKDRCTCPDPCKT